MHDRLFKCIIVALSIVSVVSIFIFRCAACLLPSYSLQVLALALNAWIQGEVSRGTVKRSYEKSLLHIPEERAVVVRRIRDRIASMRGVPRDEALRILWDDLVILFGPDGARAAFDKSVEFVHRVSGGETISKE